MSNLATLPTPGGTCLYAQPFNPDAQGFYFHSVEDYEQQVAQCRDRFGHPVEEFEIQYIDGDDSELFAAVGSNQCNLETWFDRVESLDEGEKVALFYLCDGCGYALDNALDRLDDVCLFEGPLLDAATELFDECYAHEIPENLRCYFDYEAFARDCRLGGDMTEFEYQGHTWTCTNASGL